MSNFTAAQQYIIDIPSPENAEDRFEIFNDEL